MKSVRKITMLLSMGVVIAFNNVYAGAEDGVDLNSLVPSDTPVVTSSTIDKRVEETDEDEDYSSIDLYTEKSDDYIAPPVLPSLNYFDTNRKDPTAVEDLGIAPPILPYPDEKSGE